MSQTIDGTRIADLISPFYDSPTSDAPNATKSPRPVKNDPFSQYHDDR